MPEEERALENPRHRLEYNLKMNLKEVRWEAVNLIPLSQDRASCTLLWTRKFSFKFHKPQGIS